MCFIMMEILFDESWNLSKCGVKSMEKHEIDYLYKHYDVSMFQNQLEFLNLKKKCFYD